MTPCKGCDNLLPLLALALCLLRFVHSPDMAFARPERAKTCGRSVWLELALVGLGAANEAGCSGLLSFSSAFFP